MRVRSDSVEPPVSSAEAHPAPTKPLPEVGSLDAAVGGWFDEATGFLVEDFSAGPDDVLLDVGCGKTPLSIFFARRAGQIILADLLPENVSIAVERMRSAGAVGVRGVVSDTNPLPLQSGSVTRVIATEVLEHVPDPAVFLAELLRVGRPGARYLFSVPDASSENLQRPIAAPAHWEAPNHIRVFDRDAFERLIVDAGLVVESRKLYVFSGRVGGVFSGPASKTLRRPGTHCLRAGIAHGAFCLKRHKVRRSSRRWTTHCPRASSSWPENHEHASA